MAAKPTATAMARRPAMRGVEKSAYCDRNAIMEPSSDITEFKMRVPPKLRTVKYRIHRDNDAANRGDR